jgi:hypothetical protein
VILVFSCTLRRLRLKLLKTYLRSTMTQERFNALALIALESGLWEKIDNECIIEDFIQRMLKEYRFSSYGYTTGIILGLYILLYFCNISNILIFVINFLFWH